MRQIRSWWLNSTSFPVYDPLTISHCTLPYLSCWQRLEWIRSQMHKQTTRRPYRFAETQEMSLEFFLILITLTPLQCIFHYFVQWINKYTINWQFIILLIVILLLHVSTLLYHLQGARSQHLLSYVIISMQFCSKTNKMHQCVKFILFWNDTLRVSDGLSVHYHEFKTVHTATGFCQTDTAVCLLASRQQYLFDRSLLLYVQSWTPEDGRKVRPKHVEFHSKIK